MQTTRASFHTCLLTSAAKMAAPMAAAWLALAAIAPVGGAVLTWSGEFGDGAVGSWNTTSLYFNNGTAAWANTTAGNRAVFAGAAGTVSVGELIQLNRLTFNVAGYRFGSTTGSLEFVGSAPQIFIDVGVTTFDVPISVASSVTGPLLVTGGGTMAFGRADLFANAPAIRLAGATTLDLGSFTSTVGGFTLTNGTVSNGTLRASSYDLRAGSVNAVLEGGADGQTSLTKTGTGNVAINATAGYAGNTEVNAGTLTLAISSALPKGTNVLVSGGRLTLATTTDQSFNRLDVTGGQVLLGVGSRLVSAGGVLLSGSGTLLGRGTVDSAVTVGSGGVIAPGAANAVGTLTTGSQTWDSGGTYAWNINNATGRAGTGWDLLTVSGDLTINSGFSLQLLGLAAGVNNFSNTTSYSWTIATADSITLNAAGLISINASGFTSPLNGGNFSISQTAHSLDLVFTPVPEPKDYAMILGAITLGLVGYRRWRRTPRAA